MQAPGALCGLVRRLYRNAPKKQKTGTTHSKCVNWLNPPPLLACRSAANWPGGIFSYDTNVVNESRCAGHPKQLRAHARGRLSLAEFSVRYARDCSCRKMRLEASRDR